MQFIYQSYSYKSNAHTFYKIIAKISELEMRNLTLNDYQKVNLIRWTYPVLIGIGLVGNLLSIKLIARICQRSVWLQYFCVFFFSLSLADLIVLLFGCGREYLDEYHDAQIRSSSLFACKFIFYFSYLFASFSAYLNVLIAVSSAIKLPTPKQSCLAVSVVFFALAFFNLPFLLYTSLNENTSFVYECQLNETPYELEIIFFDNVICSLLPLLITIVFSIWSLFKLASNISHSDECQCSIETECSCVKKEKPNNMRERVIVNFMTICFVITSIPNNYFIVHSWSFESNDSLPLLNTWFYLIGKFFNFLKFSINIFFYIFLYCSLKKN